MRRTLVGKLSKRGIAQADLYEFFCSAHIHHVSNDEYYGTPFDLEEWQRKNIWRPILGSGRFDGGKWIRRYRRALIGLPRGYGKSEIACALLLTIANMEPIYNGQYGLVASSEPQADNLLSKLKTMIALDDDLRALWENRKKEIVNSETGAKIFVFPYSESALQSYHFNVVVADELHVWRDDSVWNAIISGQKIIPNALAIAITTAGAEQRGFLWDWLDSDIEHDPACYLWWLGAGKNDDISSRAVWKKLCLPSWVRVESIEDQYNSLTRYSFERYVLNRYPAKKSEDVAIKRSKINACRKVSADFDFSKRFSVGVDGATSGDTLAICCYQECDGKDVFFEYSWSEPDESGYYDLMEVADVLEKLGKQRGKPDIGLDPARMVFLMKFLERERGIKTFTVKQQPSIMCPASAMLKESIERGKAALAGAPVLADHAGNCIREESKAYGFRFTSAHSSKSKRRIDMAIAAAMAMYIYKNTEPRTDYASKEYVFEI